MSCSWCYGPTRYPCENTHSRGSYFSYNFLPHHLDFVVSTASIHVLQLNNFIHENVETSPCFRPLTVIFIILRPNYHAVIVCTIYANKPQFVHNCMVPTITIPDQNVLRTDIDREKVQSHYRTQLYNKYQCYIFLK